MLRLGCAYTLIGMAQRKEIKYGQKTVYIRQEDESAWQQFDRVITEKGLSLSQGLAMAVISYVGDHNRQMAQAFRNPE